MKQILQLLFLSAAVALLALDSHAALAKAPPQSVAKDGEAVSALRRFLIALMDGDTATLRATTLPLSEADFKILRNHRRLPVADQKKFRGSIATVRIHTFKAGQTSSSLGRPPITFKRTDFGPDRTILEPEGFPFPFIVRKHKGQWRVGTASLVLMGTSGKAAIARLRRGGR